MDIFEHVDIYIYIYASMHTEDERMYLCLHEHSFAGWLEKMETEKAIGQKEYSSLAHEPWSEFLPVNCQQCLKLSRMKGWVLEGGLPI